MGPVSFVFNKITIHVEVLVVVFNQGCGFSTEVFWLQPFVCQTSKHNQFWSPLGTYLILVGLHFWGAFLQPLNQRSKVGETLEFEFPSPARFVHRICQVLLEVIWLLIKQDGGANKTGFVGDFLHGCTRDGQEIAEMEEMQFFNSMTT